MSRAKTQKKNQKSFWETMPGVLTSLATLITAIAGCITVVLALPKPNFLFPATATSLPAGTVQGHVLWNEQPVQGAVVYVTELYDFDSTHYGSPSTTDGDGTFLVSGVPNGKKYLYAFGNQPEFWMTGTASFEMVAGTGTAKDIFLCKDFNLISPEDGEMIQIKNPVLQWTAYPDAVDYAVRVVGEDNLSKFQRGDHDAHITETKVIVDVDLPTGKYRWRVDAFNSKGHIIACSFYPRYFEIVD